MTTVNVHEAKTHLSKLLERSLAGEEIVIAKAGKALVKLVPVAAMQPRKPGLLKGKFTVPANFDDEDQDIIEMFEGR